MAFADRRRGFAVGFPSAILYTEDAGDSWLDGSDRAEMPPFANGLAGLTAVRFLDSDRGVILGRGVTDIGDSLWLGFATEGFVLRTEDGGRSWFPAEIASEIPLARHGGVEGGSFTSVCFTPDGIGLVAGNPPLVSHDFGRTWTNIEQRLIPNGSGPRWESAHEAPQGAACQPNGLWLASPSRVFGSKDGGDTWTILSEPSSGGIFAQVSFRDLQTGWLTEGGVLRTEDGGVTWTEVDNGIYPRIGSAATVFLSETDLLSTSFTAVSVSNDGGATWNVFNVPTPGKIFGLVDVAVVD